MYGLRSSVIAVHFWLLALLRLRLQNQSQSKDRSCSRARLGKHDETDFEYSLKQILPVHTMAAATFARAASKSLIVICGVGIVL